MFYPITNIDNSYSGYNIQSIDISKISNVQMLRLAAVLYSASGKTSLSIWNRVYLLVNPQLTNYKRENNKYVVI